MLGELLVVVAGKVGPGAGATASTVVVVVLVELEVLLAPGRPGGAVVVVLAGSCGEEE